MSMVDKRMKPGCGLTRDWRFLAVAFLLLWAGHLAAEPSSQTRALLARIDRSATPVAGFEVVNAYPHDPEAFTQGLLWADDRLYESTGLQGRSSLRRVRLETGVVEQRVDLPPNIFAEGLAAIDVRLIQLSWQNELGFVYGRRDLFHIDTIELKGREGWGLTSDGCSLIASDGTALLRYLDAKTYQTTRTLSVTFGGTPLDQLNELEWIGAEIWANVWQTQLIARIDPGDGHVKSWIDLSDLPSGAAADRPADVLNGIAWDADGKRLFVTGKLWPKLYEIRVKN